MFIIQLEVCTVDSAGLTIVHDVQLHRASTKKGSLELGLIIKISFHYPYKSKNTKNVIQIALKCIDFSTQIQNISSDSVKIHRFQYPNLKKFPGGNKVKEKWNTTKCKRKQNTKNLIQIALKCVHSNTQIQKFSKNVPSHFNFLDPPLIRKW